MNSYTFSFNSHRLYTLGIILLAFLPSFGLFLLGVFLEPLYGDLTRIGSYSEREFGWTKPQLKFSKKLYSDGRYTDYHDIVVLGDSFSRSWPQQQWQNYLVAETDLSLITLDIDKNKWEDVVESNIFRKNPPKFLIFQSVERYFAMRLKKEHCDEQTLPERSEFTAPPIVHIHPEGKTRYVERGKEWNDVKLRFVLNYLKNGAWRLLRGIEKTNVRKIDLTEAAPFSSFNNREMLVFKDDLEKVSSWQDMSLAEMGCRIEGIRKQIEANGHTKFVLMIAPDKLTAYADFLANKNLRDISYVTKLTEQNQEVMPRIDIALTAAIRTGVLDVYLPDDTHWGSSGHQIIAETLLGFLNIRK